MQSDEVETSEIPPSIHCIWSTLNNSSKVQISVLVVACFPIILSVTFKIQQSHGKEDRISNDSYFISASWHSSASVMLWFSHINTIIYILILIYFPNDLIEVFSSFNHQFFFLLPHWCFLCRVAPAWFTGLLFHRGKEISVQNALGSRLLLLSLIVILQCCHIKHRETHLYLHTQYKSAEG